MAEEKVNRDELDKLLRQRRLQVNNAKKEIFPLVDTETLEKLET